MRKKRRIHQVEEMNSVVSAGKLNFRISTHKETNSVVSAAGSVHRKLAL